MDYIFKRWMSFRFGLQPLNIGYINNNEEPLLFLSVNRPETERLILPSEWIEAGITIYGDLFDTFNYALGITNGVQGKDFTAASWIRGGADGQLESFNKIAVNAQLSTVAGLSAGFLAGSSETRASSTLDFLITLMVSGEPFAPWSLGKFSSMTWLDSTNCTASSHSSYWVC